MRWTATITGLIRLTPAQHLHRHIGPPAGIAAAAGLADAPRVVLVDNPLLGLRLHQQGVAGVAIVEDPAVLAPLTDWLAAREVVTFTTAKQGELLLPAGIVPVGSGRIIGGLEHTPASLLALLGLDPIQVRPVAAPPPIAPRLLHDLTTYAQGRLVAGDAQAALAFFGADIPDLVAAYRIGYLPADYRAAQSTEARRMLIGRRFGNALVLPAFDEARAIVDLLIVRTNGGAKAMEGLWPDPRGVLAPELLHGQTTLRATASFRTLARLFAQGHRDVLLLRGVADARLNAARIAAAGVTHVLVQAPRQFEAIAAVLRAAGLRVTVDMEPVHEAAEEAPAPEVIAPAAEVAPAQAPGQSDTSLIATIATPVAPSPPPPAVASTPDPVSAVDPQVLTFVEEERDGRVAIFQAGPVRYAVTLRDDGLTQRRVVIRAHGKSCTHDLDLANAVQRERTAGSAARQVGLPAATVTAHLLAMLAAVQTREEARLRAPTVAVSNAERAIGTAFLAAPDLLAQTVADLGTMGWIGEDRSKALLTLVSISRLAAQPVWAVYRARGGAAPWQALGCIAALTPPEARTACHRVTDASLAQTEGASLRHRLLLVDQAETLRPEAALTLRILHERGGVGWSQAITGGPSTVRGPVAVLAAAAGEIDHRCRDCFLPVSVDDSPEQTAQILAAQRQHLGAPTITPAAQAAIISRHHAAQRLLERLPVVVPFADRLIFPASRTRHRDEQRWFLGLVAASALYHQHQRQRDGGAVVATEADFDHVVRCTAGLLGVESQGISAASRHLLAAVCARRLASFTMADLAGICPDWTRYAFRAAIQDLCDFGLVAAGPRADSGRGRLRSYTLQAQTAPAASGIRLRPAEAVTIDASESFPPTLATLAVVGETGFANECPEAACG